jgi:hypothetical protein
MKLQIFAYVIAAILSATVLNAAQPKTAITIERERLERLIHDSGYLFDNYIKKIWDL